MAVGWPRVRLQMNLIVCFLHQESSLGLRAGSAAVPAAGRAERIKDPRDLILTRS